MLVRSFLAAGSDAVLTRSWLDQDPVVPDILLRYCKKLMTEKKGHGAALQEAMMEVKQQHPHPYYWAQLTLFGADIPLPPITTK
jgi:CHAT domain-containing protein